MRVRLVSKVITADSCNCPDSVAGYLLASSDQHNRIKKIFTQEIFTDVVEVQHAVKVPVTPQLSSTLPVFLSVRALYTPSVEVQGVLQAHSFYQAMDL